MKPKEFKEQVKKPFKAKYEPKVKAEGYKMMLGNNRACTTLEVRLQPLEGSPDPIADDLFDKIKNEILPDKYEGLEVNVEYVGMIYPRKT